MTERRSKGDRQRGLSALLSDARRQTGLGRLLAESTRRVRGRLPEPVQVVVERVCDQARSQDPPSVLIEKIRRGVASQSSAYVLEHPGAVLAEIRARISHAVSPPGAPDLGRAPLAAEAFAGGGLYDLGLTVEGVVVREICEIDRAAVASIRANLHPTARSSDALKWTPSVPSGGLDILTGGPPCQPFSPGRRFDASNPLKGPADPRNMYPRVLEWVADAQPRIVCLENSAQLVDSPMYRAYMRWWFRQLASLGYQGTLWRLSAASFGTPQQRLRAWAVAWPKGAPWGARLASGPPATHGRPGSAQVRSGERLPWTRAFDRLNSGCCAGWGLVTCVHLGNERTACLTCVDGINYEPAPNYTKGELRVDLTSKRALAMAKKIGGRLKIEKFRPTEAGAAAAWKELRSSERRLTEYLAPTVIKRIASGWEHGLLVPEGLDEWGSVDREDRDSVEAWVFQLKGMGVRDAAKLQDVPQWYVFKGGRTAAFRQIGNGIPVNMGRAVARYLLSALGYPTPLPGSLAAADADPKLGPTSGLWPLDRADPCVGVRAPLGHPGTTPVLRGLVPYVAPGRVQRRQRPHPSREAFDEMRLWRKYVAERVGAIGAQEVRRAHVPRQQRVGFWSTLPQHGSHGDPVYVHDWKWRPAGPDDFPPGFIDASEFWGWVQGEDQEVVKHYDRIFGQVGR